MSSGEVLTVFAPSQTDPKVRYRMHVQGDEITCSCRGFLSHGRCKHQDALRRVLSEDNQVTNETALIKRDEAPAPIVVRDTPTALLPTRGDLEAMALIAGQAVKATGMIPQNIKTKEQALAVMIAGWELGLRPMTALRHVYVVNGKTEIETRAMVGIIKARRPDIQFSWPEYTQDAVTCEIARPGQPLTRVRYSRQDAEASGQLAKGGVWKSYTRDMLYAAATKRACRLACPDLINAIETGLQHSVAEAASYGLGDAEVTVLDESAPGEIPPDAYNDGDESNEPEAPPEPEPSPHQLASRFLRDAKETWDREAFRALALDINGRFENVINRNGDLMIGAKVYEQADAIWEHIRDHYMQQPSEQAEMAE